MPFAKLLNEKTLFFIIGMSEKPENSVETKEKGPVRFILVAGRPAYPEEEEAYKRIAIQFPLGFKGIKAGEPVAWFIRPEGATSTHIADTLCEDIETVFGRYYLDITVDPFSKGQDAASFAKARAEKLSNPELQAKIRELARLKKLLETRREELDAVDADSPPAKDQRLRLDTTEWLIETGVADLRKDPHL